MPQEGCWGSWAGWVSRTAVSSAETRTGDRGQRGSLVLVGDAWSLTDAVGHVFIHYAWRVLTP